MRDDIVPKPRSLHFAEHFVATFERPLRFCLNADLTGHARLRLRKIGAQLCFAQLFERASFLCR